jgi:hypothetical protein
MTKPRDPTTAPGVFGQSVYLLDPSNGDRAVALAAEAARKACRTIYKYIDPDSSGPPIAVAEAVDELHRKAGGPEHNLDAWLERRARRIEDGGEVSPEPHQLNERVISDIDEATRALRAGRGDVQQMRIDSVRMLASFAAYTQALAERELEEAAARNRRADDRRPFRQTQATGPRLVRDG